MSGIDHWLLGSESANGVSPLVMAGGALAAIVLIVALVSMVRRRQVKLTPEQSEAVPSHPSQRTFGFAWPVAIVIASLAIAWVAVRPGSDPASARRSFESRSAELTMRALAPGSPLACLDAVGNAAVEAVCEKTLFASPETLAAALAYVDARLSLFVEASALGRNSGAGDAFERLRRSIEADRYGLVAHVLTTRGCEPDNCPTLSLMRDSTQVASNLKDRTFDANVVLHAGSWRSDVSSVASAPATPPMTAPSLASAPMPSTPTSTAPAAPTPQSPSKFEFPSSASIPAVNIMSPEPAAPPAPKAAEQAAPTPPTPKPAPARRQSARERAGNEATSQPPGAPVQIAPQHEAPAPAGTLANPGPAR